MGVEAGEVDGFVDAMEIAKQQRLECSFLYIDGVVGGVEGVQWVVAGLLECANVGTLSASACRCRRAALSNCWVVICAARTAAVIVNCNVGLLGEYRRYNWGK